MQVDRSDHFLFSSIFIKKISKPEFFSLKKPKPIQTGLTRFFRFGSVLAWFFQFGSVLARFFSGFYWFGFDLVFSVSGL